MAHHNVFPFSKSHAMPEPMNAGSHHPKIKLSITPGEALFAAGTHVTGKLEMECRAEGEKGLGIGVVMIELFAVQGEPFGFSRRTKCDLLVCLQNWRRGTTWRPTHFCIPVDSSKDRVYLRPMPFFLTRFRLFLMPNPFHNITFLPVEGAALSSSPFHYPEPVPAR
jgi:hypothetical protein